MKLQKHKIIERLNSALNLNNRLIHNYYYTGLTPLELRELYRLWQISVDRMLVSQVFLKLVRITYEQSHKRD